MACLILISNYESILVPPLFLDYVNKINSLSSINVIVNNLYSLQYNSTLTPLSPLTNIYKLTTLTTPEYIMICPNACISILPRLLCGSNMPTSLK